MPKQEQLIEELKAIKISEESVKMEKVMTTQELMESQMSVSWDELDSFFEDSYGRSHADTASVYRDRWLTNKRGLFELFGNQVRIEKEVELGLTDSDTRKGIEDFLSNLMSHTELSDATLGAVVLLCSAVPKSVVVQNRFDDKFELLDMKFSAGMKFSRALGSLTKDEKEKYHIQTEFSKVAQTFKAVGTLVLSIDPVDILMMSHNPNSEWRSCHDVTRGEFRAGAGAYTVDESSFIAYAYRRTGEAAGGVEVPNKLWRQMGYISSDKEVVALSTHYPSRNNSNESTLVKLFRDDLGFSNLATDKFDPEYSLNFENAGSYHYNDLINGRSGDALVIDLKGSSKEKGISVEGFARGKYFYDGVEQLRSVFDSGYILDDSDEI